MVGMMRRSALAFTALALTCCQTYDPSHANDHQDARAGEANVDDASDTELASDADAGRDASVGNDADASAMDADAADAPLGDAMDGGATDADASATDADASAVDADAAGAGADAGDAAPVDAGPPYRAYAQTSSTGTFVNACNIAGAVHWLASVDDEDAHTTLPFDFHYYDLDTTTLWFSSNGQAWFQDLGHSSLPDSYCFGDVRTQPYTAYVLWTDLVTTPMGVCTATTGTAPSRSFAVTWANARDYGDGNTFYYFTALLHEGTDVIEFLYGPSTTVSRPDLATGADAVIGLVGGSLSSNFEQFECKQSSTIHDGLVVRFTPTP
jgi:hypothetical protein